ncbi:MAG: radical SAM protein [Thermoplasmata archaeon]|nr:radical SAM protein [Thermoplasmata archaeon]
MLDPDGKPISMVISVDVTDRCNLRCRHCFNNSGTRVEGQELSEEELLKLSEEIVELDPLAVCICGGEPLLRKDVVYKMGSILKNRENTGDLSLNMVTNGILMDAEVSRNLKEIGFNLIQVSVDGFRESHDWMRNKEGAFDSAIDAIKYLYSEGLKVGVACAPTIKNIRDIPELIGLLSELGVSSFRMQPIMPLGRATNIIEFFPSDIDYVKLSRKLKQISSSNQYPMTIEWGDPTDHIVNMSEGNWSKSISINAYGDIMISPYIPVVIGNIRKYPLKKYLNSGISGIQKLSSLKKLFETLLKYDTLDVSKFSKLPSLYHGRMFYMDLVDDDLDLKNEELMEMMIND